MAFPNLSDLAATTIEARKAEIADNVTAQNALLTYIEDEGNVEEFDGGTVIVESLSYAENANAGSYSGADILPTSAQDVITAAQFSIAQYAVPVMFTGREEIINSGKAQIINLVKNRVTVAENTMSNLLNRHLYLDGTGNGGKNLTGLGAAIVLSPTNVYGGIDRSQTTNAFWKNKKFQASVDGTGVATSATIQSYWNTFIQTVTRGTDKPNVIIAGSNVYSIFESSLQAIQRVNDSKSASAGFQKVWFQDIPVIFDTAVSGISPNVAYFLNTKYLKWRPYSKRNMVALDDKTSVNQDATVKTLVWAGNLTCSFGGLQGIYSNT
jgi:hypothetical protein